MKKADVLEYFGGVIKTSAALKINKSSVSQWGSKIPMLRAYEIERLTHGKLKALPECEDNQTGQPI